MGTATTTRTRDARLDVVRGLAIAAIVLVHVFRGLNNAGVLDYADSAMLDRIVGPWCLSVFAFVGGSFVPRGVSQRGVAGYVRDRAVRFFVIYVIWTALQGSIQLLVASAINLPVSVGTMLSLWIPDGQLWYLPFLILVTVVFVPLKPWMNKRAPWALLVAAAISIGFWGYDGGYVGTQGLGLVLFFVAGMAMGGERVRAILDRFSPVAAAVVSLAVLAVGSAISVLTAATGPTVFWETRTVVTVMIGVIVSLAASAATVLLGQGARALSLLAMLGRRSLDIYLVHIIMAAGTRVVLMKLQLTSTPLLIVTCFVAGVLGSVAVATGLRRIGLSWVFDGPGWLTRQPSSSRQAAAWDGADAGVPPRS